MKNLTVGQKNYLKANQEVYKASVRFKKHKTQENVDLYQVAVDKVRSLEKKMSTDRLVDAIGLIPEHKGHSLGYLISGTWQFDTQDPRYQFRKLKSA